jgi:hypothetical protein
MHGTRGGLRRLSADLRIARLRELLTRRALGTSRSRDIAARFALIRWAIGSKRACDVLRLLSRAFHRFGCPALIVTGFGHTRLRHVFSRLVHDLRRVVLQEIGRGLRRPVTARA